MSNLRYAAPLLKPAGIKLLIEPINTRDLPGFFLSGTRQAIEIIEAVGSDNLCLQYDIYHMQIMEGDVAPTIERQLPRIAHMQLADVPGRHEPGTGDIDFGFAAAHHRSHRLRRVDRLRVRSGGGNGRRPRVGGAVSESGAMIPETR